MAHPYHEPPAELSPEARNLHRALDSLMEELEAVNWYNERADVTGDEELKDVLIHNRNEEIEHAAMLLEWIRRRVPKFDEDLKTYLFTTMPITAVEEAAEAAEAGASEEGGNEDGPAPKSDLGIGSTKKGH